MSLESISDRYLARRAATGDGAAFAELARRYQPLLGAAAHVGPEGGDVDDARQHALIGLFVACRATDGQRSFAGIAKLNVRWELARARRDAATRKHRVLTHALRDETPAAGAAGWLPAPAICDPARIVELRERAAGRPGVLRLVLDEHDAARRHSAATVARALDLVAQGHTIAHAARLLGVSYGAVHRWVRQAPSDPRVGRAPLRDGNPHARRYSDQQRRHAIELVTEHGHTLRTAAAAVGAAQMTVHRWLRAAA